MCCVCCGACGHAGLQVGMRLQAVYVCTSAAATCALSAKAGVSMPSNLQVQIACCMDLCMVGPCPSSPTQSITTAICQHMGSRWRGEVRPCCGRADESLHLACKPMQTCTWRGSQLASNLCCEVNMLPHHPRSHRHIVDTPFTATAAEPWRSLHAGPQRRRMRAAEQQGATSVPRTYLQQAVYSPQARAPA